jgi:hypothetical protein
MINIFIDTSGSMSEMGKDSGTIYISKSIQDYCKQKSLETLFYKLDGSIIDNLTSLEFNDSFNEHIISDLANSILISDGLLELKNDFLFDISLTIGIDANINNLEKVSKRVFEPENIVQSIEYLIYQNNILENIVKIEDDEDEW